MRPWRFHFGPMFVPTEGREKMAEIAAGVMTLGDYIDAVWEKREQEKPQHSRSLCNWPMVLGTHAATPPLTASSNVRSIGKKTVTA